MLRVIVVLSVLSMLVLPLAQATTPDSNGQSKENSIFEGQGHGNIPAMVKAIASFIAENHFFTNGILTLQDTITAIPAGDSQYHTNTLEVGLETRVWGYQENIPDVNRERCAYSTDCEYSSGGMIFPIEIKVRANTQTGKVDISDVRAGVFRLIVSKASLTAQALSYVLKSFDQGVGSYGALEFASITINDAVNISNGGILELVYKGSINIGMGWKEAGTPIRNGVIPSISRVTVNEGLYSSPAGSIGLRIAKKILVEGFAGITWANSVIIQDHSVALGELQDKDGSINLTNKYWGVGIRFMARDWIHFRLAMREDQVNVVYTLEDSANVHYKNRTMIYSGALELHY